jgi:hypothetical protein
VDHRDFANAKGSLWKGFRDGHLVVEVFFCDEDGVETVEEARFPCHMEVCPTCHGNGSYVVPGIDSHGITAEERDRDWSHDEWDGYMSGQYDQACAACDGKRVVPVPTEPIGEPQTRLYKAYLAQLRDAAEAVRERLDAIKYGY